MPVFVLYMAGKLEIELKTYKELCIMISFSDINIYWAPWGGMENTKKYMYIFFVVIILTPL